MSEAVLQYIVSPVILAIFAGIGWVIRSYLKAIRHQVENDHGTNLRADVDRIILAVEKHDDNDAKLTEAVQRVTEAVQRVEAWSKETSRRVGRLEGRFDHHMDKND